MRVLDLFSGIGAFSLGLERAGMQTVAFCEIDPFCRRVLAKHWPEVPCYDDVRSLTADRLRGDGIDVDLICGGFPCQDISIAGRAAGIDGERSGLWREYARLIGEIRPRHVIVENVAALLGRGLGDVLGDMAALGFDAEWHCIPASAVGAPHQRDRIWIVADANRHDGEGRGAASDAGNGGSSGQTRRAGEPVGTGRPAHVVADAEDVGRQWIAQPGWEARHGAERCGGRHMGFARSAGLQIGPRTLREWAHAATTGTGWWATEPDVGRVVDGPASRVDRRKRIIGLGNSLVPQIPELIGRAILATELAA
jgi:DNA (cytosine-5)-methyltransferase 1